MIGPALIVLAAVVAVLPQMILGNSCGHDFDFHLVSWLDCVNAWRHGIFYPHWSTSANYGAGEPRFVFYPPLTWMLGAVLSLFLPWVAVPVVLTFLLLAATGLATRALARQALSDAAATLAGCAALFSGYALYTAYERSAFGELTGGFWIPLVLLLILRDRNPSGSAVRRAFDGSAVPLALAVAGAWLCNAPVGVMACYLLAGVALAAALLQRSWAPVLRGTVAAAIGIGLAAFFLVPAAFEQRWVDIRQTTDDPGERIENSFLFARHASQQLELHDIELLRASVLAVTMVAVALGGLLLARRRKTLAVPQSWWVPLALIPVVILFLQLPISLPVWNLLPKVRFLQFPWRWLVALEAPMGIFFAAAIWPSPDRRRWSPVATAAVCTAFFLAVTSFAGISFFQQCDDEDAVAGMLEVYRTGAGFAGTDEYAPVGADDSLLATGLPSACLVTNPAVVLGQGPEATVPAWDPKSCDETFAASPTHVKDRAEHLRILGIPDHAGYLVLRLRAYPAWQIRVNGRPVTDLPRREDGLIAVPVPAAPVDLTVDWTTTPDVRAGRWLSLLSVLLLTALWSMERKLRRPGLS